MPTDSGVLSYQVAGAASAGAAGLCSAQGFTLASCEAPLTISPLTITLPTGSSTGTGTVTLTNAAAAGGAQLTVTNVAVTGGNMFTYLFTSGALAGPDTCTGAAVAPGASCSVSVRFTNLGSPKGTNQSGTITFTDTGAGSPQSSGLIGYATP